MNWGRRIRASELAEFVYCEQAWWFRRQGYVPRNRARLVAGWEYHREHTRQVRGWLRVRRVALALLALALVLALAALGMLVAP